MNHSDTMTALLSEITGDRIEQWADTALAPTILPDLVRRLLLTTVALEHLSMPADGGTWQGGFDGTVIARESGAFWPKGPSAWEVSVSQTVEQKLNRDLAKRTETVPSAERSRMAYVAVTARRFPKKMSWLKERASENEWRSVDLIDADDLAAWLTTAPTVAIWFASAHLGLPVSDISTVDSFLDAWSRRTQPPIGRRLALSRRSEETIAFRALLESSPTPIRVAADTHEEAVVFAAAAIALDESPLAEQQKLRALVVYTESALRWAVQHTKDSGAVLLPTFPPSFPPPASTKVRVLIPLDPTAAGEVHVQLGRVRLHDILNELVAAGVSEERARHLAGESQGRLGALQRLLGYGHIERPAWVRQESATHLLALLLVGAFAPTSAADREVFEAFGTTAENIEQMCNRLLHVAGGPIVRKGGLLTWASHRDVWDLLARDATIAQLDAFLAVAQRVLVQDDPGLDVSANERFRAALLGKGLAHTAALRGAIAVSVARLAYSSNEVAGGRGPRLAERVVHDVLSVNWRRWASLGELLGTLAEAAPHIFLDRLDESIQADDAGASHLFREETGLRIVHTGLLWALEKLAWMPVYLSRVVLALAKLAATDRGGTWANRPSRSLHGLLHERMPQSTASIEDRIKLMKLVANRQPNVAWDLCMSMLSTMGMMIAHPRPDFLIAPAIADEGVTEEEFRAQIQAAIELLLSLALSSADRWCALLDRSARLGLEQLNSVLDALDRSVPDRPNQIWDQLRKSISLAHLQTRSEDFLTRLRESLVRFTPHDPITKVAYLFSAMPDLADDTIGDYRLREAKAQTLRRDAVTSLLETPDPWPSLCRLALEASLPGMVGELLAESARADEIEKHLIENADEPSSRLLPSFLVRREREKEADWFIEHLRNLVAQGRVSDALNAAVRKAPTLAFWRQLEVPETPLVEDYWRAVQLFGKLEVDAWPIAIARLVAVGRAAEAVVLADSGGDEVPASDAFVALKATASLASSGEAVANKPGLGAFEYHVQRLLDRVAADQGRPPTLLRKLEK